jgi:hypothetical protein
MHAYHRYHRRQVWFSHLEDARLRKAAGALGLSVIDLVRVATLVAVDATLVEHPDAKPLPPALSGRPRIGETIEQARRRRRSGRAAAIAAEGGE